MPEVQDLDPLPETVVLELQQHGRETGRGERPRHRLLVHGDAPRRTSRRCRGTVYSYTVTHQDVPGYTAPFAVVIVELEEQAGLRMVSNVVDVPPDDVRIGMPVEVTFQPVAEDVWLPLFKKR